MIEPTKLWCSVDPAKGPSGIAFWEGETLHHATTIKKYGGKGYYWQGEIKVESMQIAWDESLNWATGTQVFIEKGAGMSASVHQAQGFMRGYIQHICDTMGATLHEIHVNTWRRCIKDEYGVSWPSGREELKAMSVKLVKEKFGLDVSDDVSDAILVGVAAMRMRFVD